MRGRRQIRTFVASLFGAAIGLAPLIARGTSLHIDDVRVPDPVQSPGDVIEDPKVRDLCAPGTNSSDVRPSSALCEGTFAAYRIAEQYRYQYECAFVLPPAIGGTTTAKNVWPQPAEEAPLKHTVENELRSRMCKGEITPAEAQRDLVLDWTTAYRRYVVHDADIIRDVAVDSPPPHAKTVENLRQSPIAPHDTQSEQSDVSDAGPAAGPPIEANVSPNINRPAAQNKSRSSAIGGRRATNNQGHGRTDTLSTLRRSSASGAAGRSPGPLRR